MFRELVPFSVIMINVFFNAEASMESYFNPNLCGAGKFSCRNKDCIDLSLRCNGPKDCKDGSDEEDCEIYLCKTPDYFRCWNNRCISSFFKCDNEDDCGDFSDEFNCKDAGGPAPLINCTEGLWRCKDKHCIPLVEVCNGVFNCIDHSDEILGCSLNLTCDGFKCKNGHCIVGEWRCDGADDCGDNSDEENCDPFGSPDKCLLSNEEFLCKDNKTCVKLKKVCDGKAHCLDKSDEGPFCKITTACEQFNCTHKCVLLPTGPTCICPQGFTEDVESKTCKDINECETYGVCDQKCKNTEGSYECYCDKNYKLQEDRKTCKAEGGEALLIFALKNEIRGYFLESNVYYPIVKKLRQATGVAFDGHHIYWSDLFQGHESIVRSAEDGSNKELLVTAGLGTPEGIAIDWTTGNFYFVDSYYKHLAVCNNDGSHCAVLIYNSMDRPRGIVLDSLRGQMYWTDWGHRPEVGRANMDGSEDISFVTNKIFWPNGLALDSPNERLYWTDARHYMVQSIKLDGTDRRIILENVVKHPFSIAVFEDRIYWADWSSDTIETCNKFTGKNHSVILTEHQTEIFGMQVFHPAMKESSTGNRCNFAFCSHLCLLTKDGYSCACPEDKVLGTDKHTCRDVKRKEVLIVGVDHSLYRVQHQKLGKHFISTIPFSPKKIGSLAYNMINNSLLISDIHIQKIIAYNMDESTTSVLPVGDIGYVVSMEFDYVGNNLYWCDTLRETIEVFNFNTMSRTVLIHDLAGDIPQSIALVPEDGVMFVAFTKYSGKESHIDRFSMDGTGRTHTVDFGLTGPLSLEYDRDMRQLFWADAGTNLIEKASIDGKNERHTFRVLPAAPVGLASMSRDMFWVNAGSQHLYWADKTTMTGSKRFDLDAPDKAERLYITSATPTRYPRHQCNLNNGNCSHLCLPSMKSYVCACPIGMLLHNDNRTCYKPKECDSEHFRCVRSNACVPQAMRCNGRQDCLLGEDEAECPEKKVCPKGMFQCQNKECIEESLHCDNRYDCSDKSDELDCHGGRRKRCSEFEFKCKNGKCIDYLGRCNNFPNCADGSDEEDCSTNTCPKLSFRCLNGQCIPKSWECDRTIDCNDKTDEHTNCPKPVCTEFKCANDHCINKKFRCDGNDDCGDRSDEYDCEAPDSDSQSSNNNGCRADQFACNQWKNTTLCVPAEARCNRSSECPHHEDEQGCGACHIDEFQCDNKWKCISPEWICDSLDDCGDGSDETFDLCNNTMLSSDSAVMQELCSINFNCLSGECVPWSTVCNGENDCDDGSDEGGACTTACVNTNNPCTQECIKTPTGPKCSCHKGFKLRGDGRTCIDIEECQFDPPLCSQRCKELQGSYECSCFEGFGLRPDHKSCKSIGAPMSIYFTVSGQIRRYSKVNVNLDFIFTEPSPTITGLDVDMRNDYIYFSVEETGMIHKRSLKDQSKRYVEKVGRPRLIALDWISHHIYFVNAIEETRTINVCNFNVKKCATLLTTEKERTIGALAVDAVNKYLFYAVNSWERYKPPGFTIFKANLDGSQARPLIGPIDGSVNGLTYDLNKHIVYYADDLKPFIGSVSYNGRRNATLFENIPSPSGLNFFEDALYFLVYSGQMMKCPLYGPKKACVTFKVQSSYSRFFVIAQESRQPVGSDTCASHQCDYMCIPTPIGPSCLCKDGQAVDEGEVCGQISGTGDDEPHFHEEISRDAGGSHVGVALGITIPIICVLLGGYAYYYVERRKRLRERHEGNVEYHGRGDNGDELIPQVQHEFSNPMSDDEPAPEVRLVQPQREATAASTS